MLTLLQKAPDFLLLGSDGQMHSLSALRGKKGVLYFYPKDNTPGCTQEACDLRDNMAQLSRLNAVVLGVSKDSIASHEKFRDQYQLNFILLSDPDMAVHKAYGAEKDGRTVRSTFIINSQGQVARTWYQVNVKGHIQEVLRGLAEVT